MFLRSIFVGFLVGVLYAGAYTTSMVDWLWGGSQTYMFGSLAQAVEGQVRSSVASVTPLNALVGGGIIFMCTLLGLVIWPMVERAVVSVSSVLTWLRENQEPAGEGEVVK